MEKGLTKAKGTTSENHGCFTASKPVSVVVIEAPKKGRMAAKRPNWFASQTNAMSKYRITERTGINNLVEESSKAYFFSDNSLKYPRSSNEITKSDLIARIENNVLLGEKNLKAHITSKFNELINPGLELEELLKIYIMIISSYEPNLIEEALTCYNLTKRKKLLSRKIERSRFSTRRLGKLKIEAAKLGSSLNLNQSIEQVVQKGMMPMNAVQFAKTPTRQETIEVVEKLKRLRTIVSSISDAKIKGAYTQNELYSNEILGD